MKIEIYLGNWFGYTIQREGERNGLCSGAGRYLNDVVKAEVEQTWSHSV